MPHVEEPSPAGLRYPGAFRTGAHCMHMVGRHSSSRPLKSLIPMRFYSLEEDKASRYTGDMSASHSWGLPGVHCPTCRVTWGGAGQLYPSVELSALPQCAEFEEPRPEPFEEFARLRELVRPLAPPGALLRPGTRFGPLTGSAWGSFGAFFWVGAGDLMVRREALEQLQARGIQGLQAVRPKLRYRHKKNPPDLLELQLHPAGRLHPDCIPPANRTPCPTCDRYGFALPEEPVLEAASLPSGQDVFRLINFATLVVGTERFVDAVQSLGLDGMAFRELPTR